MGGVVPAKKIGVKADIVSFPEYLMVR
jgi:hypothetical protein